MNCTVFDIEVFKHDWIATFHNDSVIVAHNDPGIVQEIMVNDPLLAGFNNKRYDNYILKAILTGADNQTIKDINDFIIGGHMGWQHPWFQQANNVWFDSFDLFDDVQKGLSLKAIEAHLGQPVLESTVPFDIDRPLTPDEVKEVIEYCKYDVAITKQLLTIRKDYLQGKIELARMGELNYILALGSTNAKLAAMFLRATKKERKDERDYEFPSNLKADYIPEEIMSFFKRLHDPNIPSKKLFKSKLKTNIGGCPTVFGFGGVHGSLSGYHEKATDTRVIQNRDVASMYPSLMIQYNYASRNIPSFDIYKDVYDKRMTAKKTGDRKTDQTLKLVLNTKFGGMGDKYNDLYDPLMFRSVCVSGQLFVTSLVVELQKSCTSLKLLNLNTDSCMYSVDKTELAQVEDICKRWEANSRMVLENEDVNRVWIKDVNNVLYVTTDGKVEKKGGYLTHGQSIKGAWNINNNFPIVKDAVMDYFVKGIPVEETIRNCNDLLRFQIIAKASRLYSNVFQIVGDDNILAQRCNRVYAVSDPNYGTLYKTHSLTGSHEKIGGLPDHCRIDNKNVMKIGEIDKSWYEKLARKYVNDYLGIKPHRVSRKKIRDLQSEMLAMLEREQLAFI